MSIKEGGSFKIKPVFFLYALAVLVMAFVIYELTKINSATYMIGR